MTQFLGFIGAAIIGIILAAVISVAIAVLVMICWNAVMPYLFHLPTLTWGKAWCLTFLMQLLVRSTSTVKVNN